MARLSWDDLLIKVASAEQFEQWLGPWRGVVEGMVAPVFLNKFGCWFLRRHDGSNFMLDVMTGDCEDVAQDDAEFATLVNQRDWQENFLLSEVVFDLQQAGVALNPGQCYGLAPHPALGGSDPFLVHPLDPRFVIPVDVGVWQSICAQALHPATLPGS